MIIPAVFSYSDDGKGFKGTLLVHNGDPENVLPVFKTVLSKDPKHVVEWIDKGAEFGYEWLDTTALQSGKNIDVAPGDRKFSYVLNTRNGEFLVMIISTKSLCYWVVNGEDESTKQYEYYNTEDKTKAVSKVIEQFYTK